MDVNSIISLARTLTWTNSNQVDDSTAQKFLNLVYHDIEASIESNVNQDYFWDIWTADVNKWQNEYVLESSGSSKEWMNKILRVEVKFKNNDTYRTLVQASTLSNYDRSTDYLEANLHSNEWFFDIKENSIFIYPIPDEDVNAGLKIHATITLPDLQTWDWEDKVFPWNTELRRYHEILAIWMKQYIFALKWQTDLQNNAIQEYRNRKQEILTYLSPRYASPIEADLPYNNYFKY